MNDSPSSASLASSLKKPSTAASSTTSKRTRTIIVARSITDASPSTLGAAERPSALNTTGNSAGAGSWRSNEAKLPAYAALGGAEDVALYEKYLAERKGHSSVAELRAMGGASSPQHLKASMKRKTMSQLLSNDNSGAATDIVGSRSMSALPRPDDDVVRSSSGGAPADTSAATRALVQLEMASDAKKRREALVAHRKWLKTLPIHERLAHARQHNALKHWQQINRDWERFKARAAKKLNKPAHALVMSRAAAYREQVEMYDALQKARPLADKVGGDIWLVSLRDDGTRFVPVGNIFSGLFCPIRESTRIGPRVRRPLDVSYATAPEAPGDGDDSDDNNSSSSRQALVRPVSQLEKRSLEMLAKKKRRLRKQLQALLPHEVERSAAGHLVVETADLFEWASRGHDNHATTDAIDVSDANDAIARAVAHDTSRSVSQGDETSRVKSARTVDTNSGVVGPSLRLAIESESAESGADVNNSGAQLLEQLATDASSEPAPVRLSFYGDTHQQLQRSITLENDGSTVLHYEWTREAFVHPVLTPHLQHARSRKTIQEQDDASVTTSLSQTLGTLLPGETQAFVFSFETQRPGMYLEKWLLDVDPPARVQVGACPSSYDDMPQDTRPLSPATPSARRMERPQHGAIQVHLSCTAVDNFVPRRQHLAQHRVVERKATVFMVERLVDELLAHVDAEPRVVFPDLHALASRFYDVNRSDRAFSDVYYSDALVAQCRELFAQATRVITCAQGAPPAVATDDDGALSSEDTHVDAVEQPRDATDSGSSDTLAATQRADEWDLRFASLAAITNRADALNAVAVKTLQAELAAIAAAEEEEQEDDDEDEENEDEEEEDSEDDEDDSDDSDTEPQERPPTPRKEVKETRAARRERVARERSARRQELNDTIAALRPRLQDAFRIACLEAHAAPYASTQLHARLAQGIASLCSEVPVIHAIARMQDTQGSQGGADANTHVLTERGVAQVLARAIDEAVAFDADYQSSYELARRESQRVLLRDVRALQTLLSPPAAATGPLDSTVATVPQRPTWFARGVLLLHVDLDLASWFTLVKEQGADVTAPDAASAVASPTDAKGVVEAAPVSLAWQFSPELLAHETFVPAKVALVAQTLASLMALVAQCEVPVKAIVLASDLSAPPVTKAAQKLLQQALASANTPSGSSSDDARVRAARRTSLLQRLASQLSLHPVTTILKRAMSGDTSGDEAMSVDFCASLGDLEAKVHALETSDAAATARSAIEGESEDASASASVETPLSTSPTIFLLEHLDALARAAGGRRGSENARPRSAVSSSPAAPAVPPPEAKPVPTPAAAAGKKSVAAVPAPKAGAPLAADAKTPVSTAASSAAPMALAPVPTAAAAVGSAEPTPLDDETATTRHDVDALASKLAQVCDAFIVETFLSSPWERLFGSSNNRLEVSEPLPSPPSASPDVDVQAPRSARELTASRPPHPAVLGPMLLAKAEYWAQFAQSPPLSPAPSFFGAKPRDTAVTVVLGGKDLVSKLRLIDSLLDVAHVIYFVGDVALSLYRVLFTKHDDTRRRWRGQPARVPTSLWSVLVPAVERLKQKAQRKCVQLLLPVDWVVGDTPLEEQDTASSVYDDDDDDEEEEDGGGDEDDEDNDDEPDGDERAHRRSSKATKRKHKKARRAHKKPQKPIVEPEEIAPWRAACQWQYDGETAVVSCSGGANSEDATLSWVSAFDISADFFSKFAVVDGKASVLESRGVADDDEDEEDDADESTKDNAARADDGASSSIDSSSCVDAAVTSAAPASGETTDATRDVAPSLSFVLDNPTAFEYEWTFRAFDVGPASLRTLLQQLELAGRNEQQQPQQLIIHGVCGVVECQSFDRATRALVQCLEASGFQQHELLSHATPAPELKLTKALLLSGETTLQWLQRFETPGKPYEAKLVTLQRRKMASVLRDVLAAKPNAVLLRLCD